MFKVGDIVTVTKIVSEEENLVLHNITSSCFGKNLTVIRLIQDGDMEDVLVSDYVERTTHFIPQKLLKKVSETPSEVEEKSEKIIGRKIIRTTATSNGYGGRTEIIALCDDGTLWSLDIITPRSCWKKFPDIPQD